MVVSVSVLRGSNLLPSLLGQIVSKRWLKVVAEAITLIVGRTIFLAMVARRIFALTTFPTIM